MQIVSSLSGRCNGLSTKLPWISASFCCQCRLQESKQLVDTWRTSENNKFPLIVNRRRCFEWSTPCMSKPLTPLLQCLPKVTPLHPHKHICSLKREPLSDVPCTTGAKTTKKKLTSRHVIHCCWHVKKWSAHGSEWTHPLRFHEQDDEQQFE